MRYFLITRRMWYLSVFAYLLGMLCASQMIFSCFQPLTMPWINQLQSRSISLRKAVISCLIAACSFIGLLANPVYCLYIIHVFTYLYVNNVNFYNIGLQDWQWWLIQSCGGGYYGLSWKFFGLIQCWIEVLNGVYPFIKGNHSLCLLLDFLIFW